MSPCRLLIVLVIVTSWQNSEAHADWAFRRGDCNSDAAFDISDPIKLLDQMFLGGTSGPCADACDANDDGDHSVADAIFMLDGIFGAGPLPGAPYLECGSDPTDDGLGCDGPVGGCPAVDPMILYGPPGYPISAPWEPGFPREERPGTGDDLPTPELVPHSGEYELVIEDLTIPGRGLDFVWKRSYHSRVPTDGLLGNQWDHSYNIFVAVAGSEVHLHSGNGRLDVLELEGGGQYGADGLFHTGEFEPGGDFVVSFPNHGLWTFEDPQSGAPTAGKVTSIVDRNGNTMTFQYDGAGRLTTITDTLSRVIALAYTPSNRIASVTDFSGRTVTYEYYESPSAFGSVGDLLSVTSPAVTGTPTGNDYPSGKTTTYTYTTGFAEPDLNGNLQSIVSPRGDTVLINTYGTSGNEFDRLIRQEIGGDFIDIWYDPNLVDFGPIMAQHVIFNDRRGIVTETFYDDFNRCVGIREYTGFANPTVVTTDSTNRPQNRLRDADPAYFETLFAWNDDSRLTIVVHPNTNRTEYEYELELDPMAPRAERGNLRRLLRLPGGYTPAGVHAMVEELWTYEPGFGGLDGMAFAASRTDALGNVTGHTYDSSGNRIQTQHPIVASVEDWEYNGFGQVTAHVFANSEPAPDLHRRRDELTYHDAGPGTGYLSAVIVDALELALTTEYQYDAVGNLIQVTNPAGHVRDKVVNALNQVIQEFEPELPGGARALRNSYYDANDNLVRVDVLNFDENGTIHPTNPVFSTLHEYDPLDNLTRTCREYGSFDVTTAPPQLDCSGLPLTEFAATEFAYDANDQLSSITHPAAVDGTSPFHNETFSYDERGLLYRSARAAGSASVSTTQYDYDRNRNLSEERMGLESVYQSKVHTYDAYDLELTTLDAMGNLDVFFHDQNGNRVVKRRDGESVDVPGSVGNQILSNSVQSYDAMNRPLVRLIEHFTVDPIVVIGDGTSSTFYYFAASGHPTGVTNDRGNLTQVRHDTAHRLIRTISPDGSEVQQTYDANGNVATRTTVDESTSGGPVVITTTTFSYDAMDRLVSETDPLGHTTTHGYDSRGNRVLEIDALGNVSRWSYDGLDRDLVASREMTDTGLGAGTVVETLQTSKVWDASGRLIQRVDAKGNATSFAYDGLGRVVSVAYADGTSESYSYDAHDNLVSSQDANGTNVIYNYDALNRNIERSISPGPGVSFDTTFEEYDYDGMSRIVFAQDNDAEVFRQYDSMSNMVSELPAGTMTGQVTREFDGVGNKIHVESFSGGAYSIDLVYDANERLVEVSDSGGTIVSYEYIGSRVETRDHGNDTRLTYGYDAAHRVTSTSHVRNPGGTPIPLDDRTFGWDDVGNKTSRTDTLLGGPELEHAYSYDSRYRLVATDVETGGGAPVRQTAYVWDAAGNRLSVADGECAGAYTMVDTAPQFDEQVNQYTTTGCDSRFYDNNGNVLDSREYDYRNQLVADFSTGFTSYLYDPFGRLLHYAPMGGGGFMSRRYIYDDWQVIRVRNGNGQPVAELVNGRSIDEVVRRTNAQPFQQVYYHADDLGNVMAISDAAGQVVERYEYGDFGTPQFLGPLGNDIGQTAYAVDELFNGRRYESALGIYHYRHRHYDPEVGRFLSRDPLGIWGDEHNHGNGTVYVGNNPWTHVDPMGLATATADHKAETPMAGPHAYPPDEIHESSRRPLRTRALRGTDLRPASPALRPAVGRVHEEHSTGPGSPGMIRAFNPQPEPPAGFLDLGEGSSGGPENPLSIRAFNPQPEPPAGFLDLGPGRSGGPENPLSIRAFNPQPEPPAGFLDPLGGSLGGL